jgi:hydrogenase-4 component B
MGLYGLLRILTNIHSELYAVGLTVLCVSMITGVWGVIKASSQLDVLQVLTYHSVGNNGITGIGIGAGLLGIAFHTPNMAALAFTGSILHIFNHSLFQSLLFYGAGVISHSTHSSDITRMGGLMKLMPKTALLFLLGTTALCSIPPFNGFISEFLIVIGLFKGGTSAFPPLLWPVIGMTALVLISVSAIYHLAKVFTRIFLGVPRTAEASQAGETPENMIFSMVLTALPIVLIGLFPHLIIPRMTQLTKLYVSDTSSVQHITPPFLFIGISAGLFVTVSIFLWQRYKPSKEKKIVAEHHST